MASSVALHIFAGLLLVQASRDTDTKSVEVSGSHFVAAKSDESGASTSRAGLSEIQRHRGGSGDEAARLSSKSMFELTPTLRSELSSFSKAAIQALANSNDPHLSQIDKMKAIHSALVQATNAVKSVAIHSAEQHPHLANAIEKKIKEMRETVPPSFLEQQSQLSGDDSASIANGPSNSESRMAATPEMKDRVRAFAKLAQQALQNGNNPDMSTLEKANHVRAALSEAANAFQSMTPLADPAAKPELDSRIAEFKEFMQPDPSLNEKGQGITAAAANAAVEPSRKVVMTPEIRAKVKAFGAAAVDALAKSEDTSLSPDERSEGLNAALAQAAEAMTSVAQSGKHKMHPELEQHLANFREAAQNLQN
jgi:hypothetical protein